MPQEFNFATDVPLSLITLLINLGVGVVLSFILRWHFMRFGSTLSNREEFAQVFPFILLTTILIITVVKSSLALSLGLVGALSIVRFRTPIKEPEELAYLFMAIAMGLGLGAAQTIPTVIAGIGILGVMAVFSWKRSVRENKNLFLSLDWGDSSIDKIQDNLELLNQIVMKHSVNSDLRRYAVNGTRVSATYFIDIDGPQYLSALCDDLRKEFPGVDVTFLDQNQLPSL